MSTDAPLLSWQTHEFEKKERHRDWPWYAGLFFILAAVTAFFFGNIFFGIFLILAGALMVFQVHQEPTHLTISLFTDALEINTHAIPYAQIEQFWLDETGKADKLLLRVRRVVMPLTVLPLEGVSADAVRGVLTGKIPEVKLRESTSIHLFDRLGF